MSTPSFDDPSAQSLLALLLSSSGFGLWFREKRRGRKDAYTFALELLHSQHEREDKLNMRIDALTLELGNVQGRVAQLAEQNAKLIIENADLRADAKKADRRRNP